MGASVQPERDYSPDNPFAPKKSGKYSLDNPFATAPPPKRLSMGGDRMVTPQGDTLFSATGFPKTQADDTSIARSTPPLLMKPVVVSKPDDTPSAAPPEVGKPGFFDKLGALNVGVRKALIRNPLTDIQQEATSFGKGVGEQGVGLTKALAREVDPSVPRPSGVAPSEEDKAAGRTILGNLAMAAIPAGIGRLAREAKAVAPEAATAIEAPKSAAPIPAPQPAEVPPSPGAPALTPALTLEYRHSGIVPTPEAAKSIADVLGSAIHSPAAAIRESHPDLTAAGEAAIGARANATHIGQTQTKWVTDGIDPKLADAFVPQMRLDRFNQMLAKDPSLARDPVFAKNLADTQAEVPQGFHETPEFKTMAQRHKDLILSQTEPAASSAGLKPEQFADLPHGYMRLVPSGNETAFADDVGGTGPRKVPATRLTTAQKATGTGAYTNSYAETTTADAMDKVVKGRQNEFYQQLLKDGKVLDDPRASVPEGQAKVMFNDSGGVIDDPSQARITLQVPKDVALYAKHVYKALNESGPTTPAGLAMQKINRTVGSLALSANPVAATSHSLTLANTVGNVPEAGKPLNNLIGLVPGGQTASGLGQILSLDRTAPETRALEARLSRISALRPNMEHPTEGVGAIATDIKNVLEKKFGKNARNVDPHELLFGEDGIDVRARDVLAQKYIDAAKARNIPVTDAALREFVVNRAGDYIKGNAGALVNHLQDSGLSMFARMGTTKLSNAGRTLIGDSGLPAVTTGQKVADRTAQLVRGPVGYGTGLTALSYLIAPHSPLSNEPGHMGDLEYGTDEQGKKEYIRGAVLNTLANAALKAGGEGAIRGNPREAAKDATNTALGIATSHPLLKAGFEAATGRAPYIDEQGVPMRIVPPELSGKENTKARLVAAARDMTSIGQHSSPDAIEKNPSMPGGKALSYLLPPITTKASPGGETRLAGQAAHDWLDDRTVQVARAAGNPDKQQDIIEQAIRDAQEFNKSNPDEQVTQGMVEKQLRRAAAKANAGVRRPDRLVRPAAR